jgi:hypothetical protein
VTCIGSKWVGHKHIGSIHIACVDERRKTPQHPRNGRVDGICCTRAGSLAPAHHYECVTCIGSKWVGHKHNRSTHIACVNERRKTPQNPRNGRVDAICCTGALWIIKFIFLKILWQSCLVCAFNHVQQFWAYLEMLEKITYLGMTRLVSLETCFVSK